LVAGLQCRKPIPGFGPPDTSAHQGRPSRDAQQNILAMTIKLQKDAQKYLIDSIKRFCAENFEMEIGDLKAQSLLDFCITEIAPTIYNQAIADAQAYFQDKASDLAGARYEPEFDYWKK
jgi:uncharacterized protein (DUF2164 family)